MYVSFTTWKLGWPVASASCSNSVWQAAAFTWNESLVCSTTGICKLQILLDGTDISQGSFEASLKLLNFFHVLWCLMKMINWCAMQYVAWSMYAKKTELSGYWLICGAGCGHREWCPHRSRAQQTIRTREDVLNLLEEMMTCNPRANRTSMFVGAKFDGDGFLQFWWAYYVHIILRCLRNNLGFLSILLQQSLCGFLFASAIDVRYLCQYPFICYLYASMNRPWF